MLGRKWPWSLLPKTSVAISIREILTIIRFDSGSFIELTVITSPRMDATRALLDLYEGLGLGFGTISGPVLDSPPVFQLYPRCDHLHYMLAVPVSSGSGSVWPAQYVSALTGLSSRSMDRCLHKYGASSYPVRLSRVQPACR